MAIKTIEENEQLETINKFVRIHNAFNAKALKQTIYSVSGKIISQDEAQKYLDLFGEKLEDGCIEAVRNQIAIDFGKR
jgi:hypothetical protein